MSHDSVDALSLSELTPDYPELQQLAMALVNDADAAELDAEVTVSGMLPNSAATATLVIEDLLANDQGEVVLDGGGAVAIQTDGHVVDAGHSEGHVTSNGDDVSGYAYLTFDSGLTLFYPDDTDVVVSAATV